MLLLVLLRMSAPCESNDVVMTSQEDCANEFFNNCCTLSQTDSNASATTAATSMIDSEDDAVGKSVCMYVCMYVKK